MNKIISIILFDILSTVAYEKDDPCIVLNDRYEIKFSFKNKQLTAILFDNKLNCSTLEVKSEDGYINRMYHSFIEGAINSYSDDKITIKLNDTEIITVHVK